VAMKMIGNVFLFPDRCRASKTPSQAPRKQSN